MEEAMFVDSVKRMEDDLFEVIETAETPMVASMASVADAFADYVPVRPAWPIVSELPTLTELVDDFTTRLVTQQGEFVRRLVRAVDPILAKVDDRPATSKPASTRTSKAAEAKVA
jgi:hypothetical protein